MSIYFELPRSIEDKLQHHFADLSAVGKEAMLVEMYRQGSLTHHELAEALGLDRFGADALLKRHRVTEDLLNPAEHADQVASLRHLLTQ